MDSIKKLENYLIEDGDKKGYLQKDINNGKVIMLSGKWGSGKTHFWQNEIGSKLSDIIKKNKNKGVAKAYSYVSLYGKTSMEAIEVDLYTNAYNSVAGDAEMVSKFCSTSILIGKKVGSFFSLGLSTLSAGVINIDAKKIAQEAEDLINNDKFIKAGEYLSDGGIVCFDDFERKSKEIDLNDLFGFISQLALNFNCKVIIIVNSEIFKSKEEEIFATVKEKTISKYLYFNPTCGGLFDVLYQKYAKSNLNNKKEIIKKSFNKVNVVNARIIIQVLDNLSEWLSEEDSLKDDETIELLVLVNINFILNHHVYVAELFEKDENSLKNAFNAAAGNHSKGPKKLINIVNYNIKSISKDEYYKSVNNYIKSSTYDENIIEKIKHKVQIDEAEAGTKSGKVDKHKSILEFIDNNKLLIQSLHFMRSFEIDKYCKNNELAEVSVFNKVNIFIESGIL